MPMTRNRRFLLLVLVPLLILVLKSVEVNAYTLVMQDGRRIEIPDNFTVDKAMLTYRVGDAVQVALQLVTIDIRATEKVNRETPGAFLRRQVTNVNVPERPSAASKTITNLDLEGFKRARLESEAAYEKRRKELGLPSDEERRQELAKISERARETALEIRSGEQAGAYPGWLRP